MIEYLNDLLTIPQVVSLNEKLQVQAKEVPEEPLCDKKVDPIPVDEDMAPIFGTRVEDHLSSGSVGSAVVDEGSPQVVYIPVELLLILPICLR